MLDSSRRTTGRPVPKLILEEYLYQHIKSYRHSDGLTDGQTSTDKAKCAQRQLFGGSAWKTNGVNGLCTEISLFLFGSLLPTVVRQLLKGPVEPKIQSHTHSMPAWEPPIGTPGCQQKHTLHGFFPDHRTKERRASDALCLLQTFIERAAQRSICTPDLCSDSKDCIKRPGAPFLETLICII